MNIRRFLSDALQSLNANKLRTMLTMLGIIIGVAAVVSMMAIGKGTSASITNSINSIGTNLVFVSRDTTVTGAQYLTIQDANALKDNISTSSSYVVVAPNVSTTTNVIYAGTSTFAQLVGTTPDYATVRNVTLTSGSFFDQSQYDASDSVAVVGANIVTNLFASTPQVVGQKIQMGNSIFTIIGVMGSLGGTSAGTSDNQVIVPLTTAQVRLVTRSTIKDQVSLISVTARSADTVDAAIAEVTAIMASRHNIPSNGKNDFTVLSQQALTATATSISGTLTLFLGGIAGISLLVGGIGIMNIMLVSVIERTREIGLRKALGARDSDILTQFLIESLIIGLTGGILGVAAGWGISEIIRKVAAAGSTALNPVITLDVVLLATLFSILVGLVFGLYPANRASKLEPVEALRTE